MKKITIKPKISNEFLWRGFHSNEIQHEYGNEIISRNVWNLLFSIEFSIWKFKFSFLTIFLWPIFLEEWLMLIYFLFSLLLIEDIPCNLIKKIIITSDHISVFMMCLEMNIFKTSDGENTNNTPAQKMTYKRAANKQISHFFTNYCQYHENIRIKLYFKHSIQVIIIKINGIIYIYGTRINIHPA